MEFRPFRILAIVATLLLAAGASAWSQEMVVGRIVSVQGQVEVSGDGGQQWITAVPFQELRRDDTIRTGERSRVSILLADESLLKMDAGTTLGLQDVVPSSKISLGAAVKAALVKAHQSLYRLMKGRVWFRAGGAFTVETPSASIGVRGTELGIEVKADGETVLSMLEGLAEMWNPHGRVSVSAGEMGLARPGVAPVKRLLVAPDDAVQWTLFYPSPVSFRDYALVSSDPEQVAGLIRETDQGLRTRGAEPALWVRKGQLHHDLGQWDQAGRAFEEALLHDVKNTAAQEGLGWVALQRGDLAAAADRFEKVRPPTEMSAVGLCLAMHRQGQSDAALQALQAGMGVLGRRPRLLVHAALVKLLWGDAAGAMADLREANAAEPSALGHGLMSNVHLVLNQKDQALAAAREAVKAAPRSSTAHVDLAWARQSHFDLPGATEAARKAVELDPADVRAKITLGQLLFGAGYIPEPQDLVDQVLAASPREPLAHSLKGFLLLARGKTDASIASFHEAITLDASQGEPHLGLGIALMRKGQIPQALEEILIATLLEPRVALHFTYLGKALYEVKEFDRAMKALEWAKVLDPLDPTPHLYSGIIRTDLNQAGPAIRDLERSVALNDNRAVYRSRFLLDQDRAVRNIDLARTYDNLGLTAMARNRAVLSLKDDPNNSAAHLFMANVLLNEKDRTTAGSSELLKALLTEPANQNSFNTFSDYTSLFERPRLQGRAEIQLGSDDYQEYTGNVWGGWENFAAQDVFIYSTRAGFKDHNFNRFWQNFGRFKYQLGWNQDFLLFYELRQGRTGDTNTDQNAFLKEDQDLTVDQGIGNFTLGYHLRTAPHSDILLVLQRNELDWVTIDGPRSEEIFGTGITLQRRFERLDLDQRYWHVAGSHGFRLGRHRILYGFDAYTGETRLKDTSRDALTVLFPPPLVFDNPVVRNHITPTYLTAYVQDTWRILPQLTLEGGVFYEKTNDGLSVPLFSDREFEIERVHPRAGLVFNPLRDHTLRFAYARYIVNPFLAPQELRPTDIAGFTVGQNALTSAVQEDLSLAWEWQASPRVFLKAEGFKRKRTEQHDDPVAGEFISHDRDFYGGSIDANVLIWDYFGLTPGYTYVRNKEHELALFGTLNPERWREDHEFRVGLHFLHPTGWKARFQAAYVKQFLRGFGADDPADFWVLDLAVEKELFHKRLKIGGRVENLLDEKFNLITDVTTVETREPARRFVLFMRYNF
jgi:tetratricopeptide (TPR) repeat protein